jgi:hypothetical protein
MLVFSVLLGIVVPAAAETITFDEASLYAFFGTQTIKGVRLSFVPCRYGDVWSSPWFCDQAEVVTNLYFSNLTGSVLMLPGEFSIPGDPSTLTLDFLNGPVRSLSFQFAASPNCQCSIPVGSLDLFDGANSILHSTELIAAFSPVSHQSEGTFTYAGAPVSRAVLTVRNLVSQDTTPFIDTITFQTAPEPATLFVVASALIGLVVIGRTSKTTRTQVCISLMCHPPRSLPTNPN